jgi:hypothetical protein
MAKGAPKTDASKAAGPTDTSAADADLMNMGARTDASLYEIDAPKTGDTIGPSTPDDYAVENRSNTDTGPEGTNPGKTGGPADGDRYVVDGHVYFEYGLPAAGIVVRAYTRGFARADAKLGETKTSTAGYYTISYQRPAGPFNLELRTIDATGAEVSLCEPKYAVGAHVTLSTERGSRPIPRSSRARAPRRSRTRSPWRRKPASSRSTRGRSRPRKTPTGASRSVRCKRRSRWDPSRRTASCSARRG